MAHRVLALAVAAVSLFACGGSPAARTASAVRPPVPELPPDQRCDVPGAQGAAAYARAITATRADDPEAATLLEAACDAGSPCGCAALGTIYEAGTFGVSGSIERARSLYQRACDAGDPSGCVDLGSLLLGEWRDESARARGAYARACAASHGAACVELGRLEVSGIGGPLDPAAGVAHFERGCALGGVFGCYFLGQALRHGIGVTADEARAVEILTRSCEEAQLAYACTERAQGLDAADPTREGLLTRACEGGDPAACEMLGRRAEATAREPLFTDPSDWDTRGVQIDARVVTGRREWTGLSAGGTNEASTFGLPPSCLGLVDRSPTVVVTLASGPVMIESIVAADSTLLVRAPNGSFHCSDDAPGGVFHPRVALRDVTPGAYAVWLGVLRGPGADAILRIDAPSATLGAPTAETLRVPTRAARYYQTQTRASVGVSGRVLLNGSLLHQLTGDGLSGTANTAQCLLRAGNNEIVIEITALTAGHDERLVHVELHGLPEAGMADDASRLFEVAVAEGATVPARHVVRFRLARNQRPEASGRCRPATR